HLVRVRMPPQRRRQMPAPQLKRSFRLPSGRYPKVQRDRMKVALPPFRRANPVRERKRSIYLFGAAPGQTVRLVRDNLTSLIRKIAVGSDTPCHRVEAARPSAETPGRADADRRGVQWCTSVARLAPRSIGVG